MSPIRTKLQAVLFVGLLICASLALLLTFTSVPSSGKYTYALNSFKSYDDLLAFLRQRADTTGGREVLFMGKSNADTALNGNAAVPQSTGTTASAESPSYSSTNVQVAGVDEPDTVKTDGTYLYTLSNNTIFILKAYPASDAAIVGRIALDENHSAQSFFVNGDRLIVFCSGGYFFPLVYGEAVNTATPLIRPWYGNTMQMSILVYDLGDRTSPSLAKEVKMDGYFSDARMIGSYVYVVSTTPTYTIYSNESGNETLRVPTITIDGKSQNITPSDIYYVDVPELADSMTHVLSLNLDTSEVNEKSFMLGSSETMYVSQNTIYLATSHWPIQPLTAENSVSSSDTETTILHKIAINASSIDYVAQGEVPGNILNQFAMDEYNGYFRIATTESSYNGDTYQTTNDVYILDANLKEVSSLKNIAPGESIYAVRFLGDRAYLVTFVEIDPLFALDLSDPQHPQVLGELKIPGYSTYLHPYDETHIIGIGRDVNRSIDADKIHTPGAVYYTAVQGLKLCALRRLRHHQPHRGSLGHHRRPRHGQPRALRPPCLPLRPREEPARHPRQPLRDPAADPQHPQRQQRHRARAPPGLGPVHLPGRVRLPPDPAGRLPAPRTDHPSGRHPAHQRLVPGAAATRTSPGRSTSATSCTPSPKARSRPIASTTCRSSPASGSPNHKGKALPSPGERGTLSLSPPFLKAPSRLPFFHPPS